MFATLAKLARLTRAAWVLARHDALLPREYQDALPPEGKWVGRLGRLFAHPGRAKNPGARFARALEQLGPAYVKLGQFLATRGDIFGQEFVEGLAGLKDRMAPFSEKKARAALRAEFGDEADTLFPELGPAIAAASVAQVHKVTTAEGHTLAVKILRPGIEQKIEKDVAAFELGAKLAHALFPDARRLRPKEAVATLARSLRLEMDLRLEAAGASEMGEIAAEVENFRVPQVDWGRSGRRVMATQWLDMIPLSDDAAMSALPPDTRKTLGVTAIRAFLVGALDYGVFHADMHEGNLFATADGQLAAVDFGIVGRIGHTERRYLADILHGFITRNYSRIAQTHFDAGYVPDTHSVADFASALRSIGEPIWGKRADEVSMGRLLLQLFEVTDLFDMALRPELVLLQKTMVQAEGVARRLDPQLNIWTASEPVVARWMAREIGPEGAVRDIASDVQRLRRAARRLPVALEKLEAAADRAVEQGVRLDDDSLARLAQAQARTTRWRTVALWLLAMGTLGFAALASALVFGGPTD